MYEVDILPRVYKAFRRLPNETLKRIVRRIQSLGEQPRPPGCKKLRGQEDVYRIRVGEYRILYRVRDAERRVIVLNIGHRRDVYRRLK